MPDFADQLIHELDAATEWPLPREKRAHDQALKGRAFRRGENETLKALAGFDADRKLYVDPLARRIAFGFADFLFSEDTALRASVDGMQGEVDAFAEVNGLQARLHRACRVSVSEGETFWKLHTNRAVAQTALVRFCSRRDVVPLFDGDLLLAAAFVTERGRERPQDEEAVGDVVYRHAEVHTDGRVVNVLYRGTDRTLGARVELTARPETSLMVPELGHGLPMWAGRVVNDLDDDDSVGMPDYESVEDLLVALCEAVTISAENARLTGVDRVMVAGSLRQMDGSFDASMQVFEADAAGITMGEEASSAPVKVIEKRYDADPLWTHIRNLVHTILSRVGLVVQVIGQDEGGKAETGTAIRLRFLPTAQAARGKTREYTKAIAQFTGLAVAIAQLPESVGGFGRATGGDPLAELPAVEFGDAVPVDEHERTNDLAVAVTGEIMSRETAVREQHPGWADEQVADELRRIRQDVGRVSGDGGSDDDPPPPELDPDPESTA